MYFANVWLKGKVPTPASAALELREVMVRNPRFAGRPLAEVSAGLPAGVRIVVVRRNRVPAADLVVAEDDVLALAGESEEALEGAQALIGEAAAGRISRDRSRFFARASVLEDRPSVAERFPS